MSQILWTPGTFPASAEGQQVAVLLSTFARQPAVGERRRRVTTSAYALTR